MQSKLIFKHINKKPTVCKGVKAATNENNAASNKDPSAFKQYISCKSTITRKG
jgi:hypothetical protein